jgi:hypothetical protein
LAEDNKASLAVSRFTKLKRRIANQIQTSDSKVDFPEFAQLLKVYVIDWAYKWNSSTDSRIRKVRWHFAELANAIFRDL